MGLFRRKVKHRDGTFGISAFWWGSYHDPLTGKFVRASTKCGDKKAAADVLRDWERRAADTDNRTKETIALRVAIASYKKFKIRAKRAAGTLHMIDVKSAHLARLLGDETRVRSLRARDVDHYIAQRQDEGAAETTIAKEVGVLMGILKLAARHEYCEHPDKLKPSHLSGESKPGTRIVQSTDDIAKLLAAMYEPRGRESVVENRRAHIVFLLATAIDWTPSTFACREDIDIKVGVVRVRGSKNEHRERTVPITRFTRPMLEYVLAHVPESGPMFLPWSNPVRDLAVTCKRAGIARVTPRDFRRTLGTWLRRSGVEPQLIAPVLGHRDGRMVERVYGKLATGDLRDLLETRLQTAPIVALLGVHSDVRETVVSHGNSAGGANAERAISPRSSCPGTESNRRHGDFQSQLAANLGPKSRWIVRSLPGHDTPMYVRTFGEVLTDALELG